jgi:hypothetical protein
MLGVRVSHIATPKGRPERPYLWLLAPQFVLIGGLVGALVLRMAEGWETVDIIPSLFLLAAASLQMVATAGVLWPVKTT